MSREKPRRATLPPVQEEKQNIDKLEKIINDGNFYGAQQMYKSISARYVSAQRYSEALDLLHLGAYLQLKHGQKSLGYRYIMELIFYDRKAIEPEPQM